MNDPVGVHPSRLCAVADLVLDMIESRGGALGLVELTTSGDLDGSAGVPTPIELEEAVTLLIRLGFIERVDRANGA